MKNVNPGIAPAIFYDQSKCPVRSVLTPICNKWSLLILTHLSFGSHRFSELLGGIPDISQRMLTQNLRSLQSAGLVNRTVTASIPPRVDYDLTELGTSFLEPLEGFLQWGLRHRAAIENNQSAAEEKSAA